MADCCRKAKKVELIEQTFYSEFMKIGVGLPATIPSASGKLIVPWANKAEKLNFSSLGVIDRIVYPNHESLITLAAAAGATKNIHLMTTILLAPIRETVLLAKQAATLDRISEGRFTLGLGVGGRTDDSEATGNNFATRGKRFDDQLRLLKQIWSGERISQNVGSVGPEPTRVGGPEILIGGSEPRAIARVARWADGYMSGSKEPETAATIFKQIESMWQSSNRLGKPRLVGSLYFALGDRAQELGQSYLKSYYGQDPRFAERVAKSLRSDRESILDRIRTFEKIAADEVIIWPCIADPKQLDLLSEALSSR